MKKELTKVQKIWFFILTKNPTRTELNCFILGVERCDYESTQSGYYGTNIAEWKRKGHVVVINKKYHITKESLMVGDGRMYIEIESVKVKRTLVRDSQRTYSPRRLSEQDMKIQELKDEVRKLRYKLSRIQQISQVS